MNSNQKGIYLNLDNVTFVALALYFLSSLQSLSWLIKGLTLYTWMVALLGFIYFWTSKRKYFTMLQSRWIILSIILLFTSFLMDHGDASSLAEQLILYLTALSFFVIGQDWGVNDKVRLLSRLMMILFFISIAFLVPYTLLSVSSGNINKLAIAEHFGMSAYSFIIFWPLLFLMDFYGFFSMYYGNYPKIIKRLSLTFFVLFTLAILASSFMAVFMMFVFAAMAYSLIVFSRKNFWRIILAVPILLFVGYSLVNFVATDKGLGLTETSGKAEAFVNFLQPGRHGRILDLDEATGYRWQRIEYSINSFQDSPIAGKGYHRANQFTGRRIASSHSSFFDGFAWFGVLSITFVLIFIKFIKDSYLLAKNTTNADQVKKNAAIFGALTSFFAISIFNPYWQFSIIYFVFFIGGWANGQLARIKRK